MAGLEFAWNYSAVITLTEGAYCSAIIKKEEALFGMMYSAGCGMRF